MVELSGGRLADMKSNERKLWQCMSNETPRAFAAFSVFLEMGNERTVIGVGKKLSKSRQIIDRWCQRYNWRERAQAWDAEQDALKREAMAREIIQFGERQANIGKLLQTKGIIRLQDMNIGRMSVRDAIACIVEGAKLERLGRGEPTEHHSLITKSYTREDDRRRQVDQARQAYRDLTRDFADLPEETRIRLVCEPFGVTADELKES